MKVERILLIAPPAITFRTVRDINPLPPMGLGYLASVAEGLGAEVRILDCLAAGWEREETVSGRLIRVGLSYEQIRQSVADFAPDLVGLSCQFSRQSSVCHDVLRHVKAARPGCVTVAGGAHATVCPEDLMGDADCDFLLRGEAEESFRQLICALRSGTGFAAVDGLSWRTGGGVASNPKRNWIQDLDALPFPAYHAMNLEMYFGLEASHGTRHRKKFMPVVTSRGCPARCVFCSAKEVWGRRYRSRSVANVIAELELLKDRYGIEELMFEDDNVTAHPRRAAELFQAMIDRGLGLVWDTPNGVGVWSMDEGLIDLMKASGCLKLNFPVESGSQRVLREVIRKPLDLAKVKRLVSHCRRIGLDHGMFLVVGLPGERLSEMWDSFRFAAACGCYTPHVSVATPYPGTELFARCQEAGYFAKPFSFGGLFIRSYMIRTPAWGEASLRLVMFAGALYLRALQVLREPRVLKRILPRLRRLLSGRG